MMVRKRDSSTLRLLITLIHLSVWAQLGVVTRAFLGKFFILGCGGGWGPCLAGSLYFKDLPSNMLGSFIIGLFAASSTLGLAVDKALALLPKGHPWQSNFELQIGIRTGFCGSLTTFASWFLELMVPAIQQNLWVEAGAGLLVGLLAAIGSYSAGLHAALAVDRWLVGEKDVLEQLERYRSSQMQHLEGLRRDSGELPQEELMLEAEPDLPRIITHEPAELVEMHRKLHQLDPPPADGGIAADGAAADAEAAADAAAGKGGKGGGAAAAAAHQAGGQPPQRNGGVGAGAPGAAPPPPPERQLSVADFGASLRGSRTDAAALLLLAAFTALAGLGLGLQDEHTWLRTIWASVLLGPAGCILRWYLSRFNYKLRGSWDWLPAGTFAANMLGVTIDCALQCVLQRRYEAAGYWGVLWLTAVQSGFCGSLTTVSTFVTEVVKFADAIPENFHAYTYAAMSLGGGAALFLALFGWSVWA
ncbi:hypothetical protein CHLNCDRAFT_144735 [Chlorella variabilis]|uniref:Fluoride ion transporter CrcB n=1 Tax=Chlorella variabilis TaxID=554065 RepID=E1ZCW8_CHLVA|nr:hypothetical protein CHLNCDRAFT_144735 [Chlorella variabilis]EFN56313.1 hypothetical protein CHLNCDRAFT_144735 [Chlorella variabilis]|eukprot:XP_005848415.1 hypothetical protein CHLNCDRAFT_144735 [Chlorella variabilis]